MRLLCVISIVLFTFSCARPQQKKPPKTVTVSTTGTITQETMRHSKACGDTDEDDFLQNPPKQVAIDTTGTDVVGQRDDSYLDWPDRYQQALDGYTAQDSDEYDSEDVDDEAEKDSIEHMDDN